MAKIIDGVTSFDELCQQLQSEQSVAAVVSDEKIAKEVIIKTAPWMFASADSAYAEHTHNGTDKFVYVAMFQFKGRVSMAAKFVSPPGQEGDDGWMLAVSPRTNTVEQNRVFFDSIVRSLGVQGEWKVYQDKSPNN